MIQSNWYFLFPVERILFMVGKHLTLIRANTLKQSYCRIRKFWVSIFIVFYGTRSRLLVHIL